MHDTAIGLHLRGHFFRNKRTVIIEIDFYPFFSGDFHHRAQVVRRKGMFQHHFHILQVIHSGAVLADDITWTTQEMQFFQKPFHAIDTTTGANDKFHTLIHCFSNHFYIFFRKFWRAFQKCAVHIGENHAISHGKHLSFFLFVCWHNLLLFFHLSHNLWITFCIHRFIHRFLPILYTFPQGCAQVW